MSNLDKSLRDRHHTPLHFWLTERQMSRSVIAKALNVNILLIHRWANGLGLPTLVNAFRIERFTEGGVPAVSWLGTELGRRAWENLGGVRPPQEARDA